MKAVALLLLLLGPVSAANPKPSTPRPAVVAYVPNWIDLGAYAPKIDFTKITQINLAFENPVDDAGKMSFHSGDTKVLELAKKHGVKVLMSIGGGSAADDAVMKPRYQMLMSAEKRHDFALKLARHAVDHGFDGIDVDIEGPSIGDDYGPFIEELATALKAEHKLLTAALSRGYGGDRVPDATLQRFDFLNIMAYDATGPWSPDRPGQHSSLAFAGTCLDYWLGRGVKPEKALLGVPFYGYGFGDGVSKKSWDYGEIVAQFPGAETRDQSGETIWYNGIPTMQAKARLALDRKLAGVMIWALNSDAAGDASLLKALDGVLQPSAPVKKK